MNNAEKISALEGLLAKIQKNADARPPFKSAPPRVLASIGVGTPRKSALVEVEAHPIALTRVKPPARPIAPPLPATEARRTFPSPIALFDDDDDIPLPLVMPEAKKRPPFVEAKAPLIEAKAPIVEAKAPLPVIEEDVTIDIDVDELTDDDIEREWADQAKLAKAKEDDERAARERAEAARVAKEKAEAERVASAKADAERIVKEASERAARAEVELFAKESAERAARVETERLAKEKAAAELFAQEKAEADQFAKELSERRVREEAEAQRAASVKAESDRLAQERAETERLAQEKAEAERFAKEEAERLAQEKAEAERLAQEKAEAERVAKAEAERLAQEKAEAERLAKEEAERAARAEAAREEIAKLAAEEAEQLAQEKAEAERLAKDQAERAASEQAEAARRAAEAAADVAPRPSRRGMALALDADLLADELASISFDEPVVDTEPAKGAVEASVPAVALTPVPPFGAPPEDLVELVEAASAPAVEPATPEESVPASTPRPREEPSLIDDAAAFADSVEPDQADEEPPPISGAVESQQFHKRTAPASAEPAEPFAPEAAPAASVRHIAEAAPPAAVRLVAEAAPPPIDQPSLVEAPPVVVEITADIVRRDATSGPAARFVAASMAYAPASFGELLDASLDLGASLVEAMADRS